MCVTLGPAILSETIVFASDAIVGGKLVHLLGYQNSFENEAPGGNAMILPFPAAAPMGPNNVIDTSEAPDVLEALARLALPPARGLSRGGAMPRGLGPKGLVHVFDSGRYTVVLSDDAEGIIGALGRVPERKRPRAARALIGAYGELYPGQPIAVCCFEGQSRSEPLLFWYEPTDADNFFLPGLDAHDGGAPELGALVSTDHRLVYGLGRHVPSDDGARTDGLLRTLPGHLAELLPPAVCGFEAKALASNGDWRLSKAGLAVHGFGARPQRVSPPGA